MYDELKRFNRILDRMEFYGEKPTLEDLKELKQDIESANDCAHDDCYSADCIAEMAGDELREMESERDSLRLKVAALKEELENRPKRRRKKKAIIDTGSLLDLVDSRVEAWRKCACEEGECSHARMKETAKRWFLRAKELETA